MPNTPAAMAATNPPPRRARRWPLVLAVFLVFCAALVTGLWHAIDALGPVPLDITIDGERVVQGLDLGALSHADKLLFAVVAAAALTSALVVVPLAMLMVLLGVVVSVMLAIGLPLLAVVAVVGLLISPLLLLGWLVWRLLRSEPEAVQ